MKIIPRYFPLLSFLWTLILLTIFILTMNQAKSFSLQLARTEAVSNFNKDVAFRIWASSHGGAYVPATKNTPPNPFLSHLPYRDIMSPDGKKLTLMNPAYMLRQIMEKYSELYGVRGHITSLKYFRPETAPDEWEKAALRRFESGAKERFELSNIDGALYLRLMRPLIVQQSCLKCHLKQGYKTGDVRGGVSISVSMNKYLKNEKEQINKQISYFFLLWFIGLSGLGLLTYNLKKKSQERDTAYAKMQEIQSDLENRVKIRTSDLKRTNEALALKTKEIGQVLETLKLNEDKLRKTLDATPFPVALVDAQDENIFYWSQSAINLLATRHLQHLNGIKLPILTLNTGRI